MATAVLHVWSNVSGRASVNHASWDVRSDGWWWEHHRAVSGVADFEELVLRESSLLEDANERTRLELAMVRYHAPG